MIEESSRLSRRSFLKSAGMGGLLLAGAGVATAGTAVRTPSTPTGSVRNLIFLCADGMNIGTLSLANHYKKAFGEGDCQWIQLYDPALSPVRALMETPSASSLVTDSAAAGSAWSCGQRVNNGSLNVAPDGRRLTPLYEYGKQAGKWLGLVTTTRITHATPASFAIADPERNAEDRIAARLLDSGVDILLGGGNRHFDPGAREDGEDYFRKFEKAGYTVWKERSQVLSPAVASGDGADCPRILGTFWDGHLPYSVDRDNDPAIAAQVPTLLEMTEAALARLRKSPNGFLLQVEGGRVDHAGHANDAAGILHEQLAFDAVIRAVRAFAEEDGQTLVIVTTDHGTGGCMLNGMGPGYNDTTRLFSNLRRMRGSFESLYGAAKSTPVPAMRELIGGKLGLALEEAAVTQLLANLEAGHRALASDLLSAVVMQHTGVNFTSHNHTGDLVELVAFGPGREGIPPWLENWQLQACMRQALGI